MLCEAFGSPLSPGGWGEVFATNVKGTATTRLRELAGRRVRDAGATVVQAARDLHMSWPTVMNAFRERAHQVTETPLPAVKVLGIDATRRGRLGGSKIPSRESGSRSGTGGTPASSTPTGAVDHSNGPRVAPPPNSAAGADAPPTPERKARRRLLRNHEDLTDEQFAATWNLLLSEGRTGRPCWPRIP